MSAARFRRSLTATTALAVPLLAGCGGGGGAAAPPPQPATVSAVMSSDGTESVTVHGTDALMFAPMNIRARVGTLHVTFRIAGLEPDTGNVAGHTTAHLALDLPHSGSYSLQCDYHPTMVGTLTVTS